MKGIELTGKRWNRYMRNVVKIRGKVPDGAVDLVRTIGRGLAGLRQSVGHEGQRPRPSGQIAAPAELQVAPAT